MLPNPQRLRIGQLKLNSGRNHPNTDAATDSHTTPQELKTTSSTSSQSKRKPKRVQSGTGESSSETSSHPTQQAQPMQMPHRPVPPASVAAETTRKGAGLERSEPGSEQELGGFFPFCWERRGGTHRGVGGVGVGGRRGEAFPAHDSAGAGRRLPNAKKEGGEGNKLGFRSSRICSESSDASWLYSHRN